MAKKAKPKPSSKLSPEEYSKKLRKMQKAFSKAKRQSLVGQGYAGLGKQELKRRQYQAKFLTKKAGAKADKLDFMANQLAGSGYPDLFGDEKWLRKQAAGYRKTQAQYDKQYNKLSNNKLGRY